MRIHVVAPATDEQRDRVERGVFERLDALRGALAVPASDDRRDRVERGVFEQLAAIRGVERAERIAPTRRAARWIPALALAGAAAVVAIAVVATRGGGGEPAVQTSSRFVVPPGQTTRFTEGDAVIVAGGDTSVEVVRGAGVTLALTRGSVECDVAPRGERPPFRVVAGDVTVEVVGTHFTVVRRAEGVRVDVAHGRVRVVAPAGESIVSDGETWSSAPAITAQAPPAVPPPDASDADLIDLDPTPAPPPRPSLSPADAYKAAERLEAKDRDAAARAYRKVADGRGAWAATALARLVEVERDRGHGASALRAIDEYLRRFPAGAAVEDVLWFRVEIHRTANRPDALRAAAAEYLRRFPSGTYAKAAARFAPP